MRAIDANMVFSLREREQAKLLLRLLLTYARNELVTPIDTLSDNIHSSAKKIRG
jgi:hypothetical protein